MNKELPKIEKEKKHRKIDYKYGQLIEKVMSVLTI